MKTINQNVVYVTRDYLLNDLKKVMLEYFLEMSKDYFDGTDTDFEKIKSFGSWEKTVDNRSLIEMWSDMLADKFFANNPNVDVVLFIVDTTNYLKIQWVCNKQENKAEFDAMINSIKEV